MQTRQFIYRTTAFIVLLSLGAPAQAAKFFGLGDLPGGAFNSRASGVSANGSVVVGHGDSATASEAFRWTSSEGLVGLGDLAGGIDFSQALAVSDDGSVVIGGGTSASGDEAFRWTAGGGMVGLGDLAGGSFYSIALDVSADGSLVVGQSEDALDIAAIRWTVGSGMVGLGPLAGGGSGFRADGVSADGSVIAGSATSPLGTQAFRWTQAGGMVGIGDLPGGTFQSAANAISDDGSVIVGNSSSAGSSAEAFRWTSGGGMVGLGDLPGGGTISIAHDVSANGSVVVGQGQTAAGFEAFIWQQGTGMQNLRSVLLPSVGAALNGWTLNSAVAISADGRTVVGQGTNPSGNTEAWLAYLPPITYWFPEASGSWDSSLSWSGPFLPGPTDAVSIDPPATVTVTGPSSNTVVSDLNIGGDGNHRATLRLDGATAGDLEVRFVAGISADGELVLANGRSFSAQSQVINSGVIRGSGTLEVFLSNSGEVRVAAGETLLVIGPSHGNFGKIEAIGGSMEFVGALTNNASTGLITGRNATYRFRNGLTNNGSLMLSFGTSDVSGDITNSGTGKIIVAGGAAATFYDDVTQNGTLQVVKVGSTNSVAVFAGAFTGSGGSSGGGDIFFLGDLRPGNSPASVAFGNNVAFASSATLSVEIGGTTQGAGYDHLNITGNLALDGALEVSLINGFNPSAGQSFNILDWGSMAGTFSSLNLPTLAGLAWNTSQLYTTGVLSVASAGLPGDYNNNGTVDAADYVVWRNNPGGFPADAYTTWRTRFGQTAAGSGSTANGAVPEPASILLTLFTVVGGCITRRCFGFVSRSLFEFDGSQ